MSQFAEPKSKRTLRTPLALAKDKFGAMRVKARPLQQDARPSGRAPTRTMTQAAPAAPTSTKGWTILARDPSKAYFERFSLVWAPVSLIVLLVGVLGTGAAPRDRFTYLYISIALCLPGLLIPLVWPCAADRGRPFAQRFWVKAAAWIAIFSFYGNYFWTHYFYHLLGARYLFDAHRVNDVPIVCFLCTFFYFTFYFALTNLVLRLVATCTSRLPRMLGALVWAVAVAGLAYGTAIFEALSIEHFPLYAYTDRDRFVTVGSAFYALYFVVGFPMFFALDERPGRKASLADAAVSALAATAIVTLLLDIWRLRIGNIYDSGPNTGPVPFIYQGHQRALSFGERVKDALTVAAFQVYMAYRAMMQALARTQRHLLADFRYLRRSLVS